VYIRIFFEITPIANHFKKALKDFLQLHSFYTLAEYLNYNRD